MVEKTELIVKWGDNCPICGAKSIVAGVDEDAKKREGCVVLKCLNCHGVFGRP